MIKLTFFTLLLWLFATPAQALRPEAQYSLLTDVGLWGLTAAVEQFWIVDAGRRNFPTDRIDGKFRTWVHNSEDTDFYNPTEKSWRKFSDVGITAGITAMVASPLFGSEQEKLGVLRVSRSFAINNLICSSLKNLFHRSRPKPSRYEHLPQGGDQAKSFPSSHASNAFVAATSYAMIYRDAPTWSKFMAYSFAGLVGIARVAGDRHNFTDILLGSTIGYLTTRMVFEQKVGGAEISATPAQITWSMELP
jgi:hypothetical protein